MRREVPVTHGRMVYTSGCICLPYYPGIPWGVYTTLYMHHLYIPGYTTVHTLHLGPTGVQLLLCRAV